MASESSSRRRQPSRLQRRAPALIQTSRPAEWNAAIPLLSPVSSPPAPFGQAPQIDSRKDGLHHASASGSDQKHAGVFKKWQAAPFSYDSGSLSRR